MESLKSMKCDGAIIVTSPQEVAIEDVRKEITFCKKTGIPILGIIENMSGYATKLTIKILLLLEIKH